MKAPELVGYVEDLDRYVGAEDRQPWAAFLGRAAEITAKDPALAYRIARAFEERIPSPPNVGGLISTPSAGDVLDLMVETNAQIEQLQADINDPQRDAPRAGQGFLTAWAWFYSGKDVAQGQEPPIVVGAENWGGFYRANSTYLKRLWSTREIWDATIAYDRRFAELHAEFVRLGGRPRQARVIVGPDRPLSPPLDPREIWSGVFWLGILFGSAYLLSQVRATIGR